MKLDTMQFITDAETLDKLARRDIEDPKARAKELEIIKECFKLNLWDFYEITHEEMWWKRPGKIFQLAWKYGNAEYRDVVTYFGEMLDLFR